jgi:hypothetical protein
LGLSLSLVVAGGIGWALGLRSHATAQELTEEAMAAKKKDMSISSEVNRTLLELWKMETVQTSRGSGQIR